MRCSKNQSLKNISRTFRLRHIENIFYKIYFIAIFQLIFIMLSPLAVFNNILMPHFYNNYGFLYAQAALNSIEANSEPSRLNALDIKRRELKETEQKIALTESEIKKIQIDADNAKVEYLKKQEEYKNAREELSSSQQKSVELYETRMRLAKDLKLSTDNYLRKKFLLKNRIKALYKNSFKKRAELLINSNSVVDFYMNLFYLSCIIKSDTEFIDEISKKVVQIKVQREELNKKLKELELMSEHNKNYEKSLKLATLQINDGISKYAQKEQLLKTQLTTLSSEKVRIEKDIDEMQQTAAKIMKIEPPANAGVKSNQAGQLKSEIKTETKEQMPAVKISEIAFTWPLKKSKNVISFYGVQKEPKYNVNYFNSGIDISGENNEEVMSAANGIVKYKGEMKSVGKILMVDHGGNITTLYSHLKSIEVGMGQKVKAGEVLGTIANEELSVSADAKASDEKKSCFLHFELRIEGSAKDPMDYF